MRTAVRPMCVLDGGPLAAGGGFRDDAVDQLGGLGLLAADSGERNRGVRADAGPGRLLDGIDLRHQQRGTSRSRRRTRRPDRTRCPRRRGPRAPRSRGRVEPRACRSRGSCRSPIRGSPPASPANPIGASPPRRPRYSRTQRRARRSTGAAAGRPSVKISARPSSSRSHGSGGSAGFGRGRRGAGDVEQAAAGARHPAGEQRCAPRIEIRVAREAYVERLELPRGLEQQQRRVAAALLGKRDLGLEQIQAGSPELVERPGLRGRQQPTSHIERPRPQAGLGGCEGSVGSPGGIACQRNRTP